MTHDKLARTSWGPAALLAALLLPAAVQPGRGQERVRAETAAAAMAADVPAAARQVKRLTPAELNEARLICFDLAEQVRIARAKLGSEALARKGEMGRCQALLAAVDDQMTVVAADVERRQERHLQLCEELETLGRDRNDTVVAPLVTRSDEGVRGARQRLENLSRHRTWLDRRLSDLHREHMQELLEAAVLDETPGAGRGSPLEELLDDEFAEPPEAPTGSPFTLEGK